MSEPDSTNVPVFEVKTDAAYSLEVVCELTGLNSQAVAHYREIGLIEASQDSFSDETIRTLRRIEHLRSEFEMSETALKLTLSLMNEVERQHDELRARR